METMEIHIVGDGAREFVRKLASNVYDDGAERRPAGDAGKLVKRLISNFCDGDAEPCRVRREVRGRRTRRADMVMTVRRDLFAAREALLAGNRDEALRRVDWTLDQMDNWLAEN